ncbi:DUF1329 domain-containing protein [Candidatus Binatus sp.]|uniref:DUF1329 domain-containing protein n=4 Tax=Candidatus Binatus sp. TaxID=2811406 RepID=UPI003C6F93EB
MPRIISSRMAALWLSAIVATFVVELIPSIVCNANRVFAEEVTMAVPDVPPVPKVIAGKPYSVTKGESPGTWVVKWGDQSMLWKTQPWMEEREQKLGPAFLAQWTTPGLPMPFEVPIEKRDKIPATEWNDRSLTYSYYAPYYNNGWDWAPFSVLLPDGSVRTSGFDMEFYVGYANGLGKEYLSDSEIAANNLKRKYLWELVAPEELRGEGGVTTVFMDPTLVPEDTLYLPTVRRTRRLAGAIAKQYFPGTIYRYEDVSYTQALPQLDYKVIGFKLFDPPETLRGFNNQGAPATVKRVSGAGDVVAIIQVTPKPGVSWWYAKRLEYAGLMGMCMYYSEEFDANGKQIRYFTHLPETGANPNLHMGSPTGPNNAPVWWTDWGVAIIVDLEGGFVQDGYVSVGGFDAKTSPNIFSETTLAAQPMTLVDWLSH